MKRATTILNESGDVTIVWDEGQDDMMEAIIQKKMDQGITFFLIEPRLGGLAAPKHTELRAAAEARKHRALSIRDADFAAFVDSGAGTTIATPPAKAKTTRVSRVAKEVAKAESVGVQQRKGG